MKKKGFYLAWTDVFREKKMDGISLKIKNQIVAMNNENMSCTLMYEAPRNNNLFGNILDRIPFANAHGLWKYYAEYATMDFLYFRRPSYFSLQCILLLRKIRKRNSTAKIILEIPTFPYDKEFNIFIKDLIYYLRDKLYRKYLYKFVDKIVTVDTSEKIFNISTIKILNGINVDNVSPICPVVKKDNTINLIMVAMFAPWHGLDRLLMGLGEYYSNGSQRKVMLYLVGTDKEDMQQYRRMVSKYNIEHYVVFCGFLNGKQLNNIYNQADIGVLSLGMHRIGLYSGSILKSREYMAKGLPMIGSVKIDVLEYKEDYRYNLTLPADDSAVNIDDIVLFYDNIYARENRIEVIQEVRCFAKNNVDVNVMVTPVVEYIIE